MFKKNNLFKVLIFLLIITFSGLIYNVSPLKAYVHAITTPHNTLAALSTSVIHPSPEAVPVQAAANNEESTANNEDNEPSSEVPSVEDPQEPSPTPQVTEIPTLLEGTVATSSTISATTSSITIQWDAIEEADGYTLSVNNGKNINTFETTDTTYTIEDVGPATICTYQLCYYKEFFGIRVYSKPSEIFTTCSTAGKVSGLKVRSRKAPSVHRASMTLSWSKMNDASYYVYYKKKSEKKYKHSKSLNTNKVTLSKLDASCDYDIYIKAYCMTIDNMGEPSAVFATATCPTDVTGLSVVRERMHQIDIKWKKNTTGDLYYIYRSVNDSDYEFYQTTDKTTFSDTELDPGTVCSYKISSYLTRTDLTGGLSKVLRCVTNPTVTTNLKVNKNTSTSLSISWDDNETATGYILYRRKRSGSFVYLTTTTDTSYKDTKLDTSSTYRYKILSYADNVKHTSAIGEKGDDDYTDGFSNVLYTSTLPSKVSVKVKAGYGRLRLSWSKMKRIQGYYIYKKTNGKYKRIDTIDDPSVLSKEYYHMQTDETYSYRVFAYKKACNKIFVSSSSSRKNVKPKKTKRTTTRPSYYPSKKTLLNSKAWKNTEIVKKYAVYNKCYTIPGIRSTNVAGFESTRMCPQGLTFSKDYMMISAYDSYYEENSVIYVMDKKTRKLLTVIVLPDKTHAGGIAYDGKNVWVTNRRYLCTVPISEIKEAAGAQVLYKQVKYSGKYKTPYKTSFLNYYKGQLWTGNFMYSSSGKLRSYVIKYSNTGINLIEKSCVKIPSAVQGVTITPNGRLILSRAYGLINELNIYKPKNIGKSNMKLGRRIKTVTMPALNEEIAISGNYLYVNFESALPNSQALNHMDRVLAIKLNAVLKVKKAKKKK